MKVIVWVVGFERLQDRMLTVLFWLHHSLVVAIFMKDSEPVFKVTHHLLQVQLTANWGAANPSTDQELRCGISKMQSQIQINTHLLRRAHLKLSRTRTHASTPDSNLLSCDACLVVQFTLSHRVREQIRMIKGSLCALYSVSMCCYLGGVTVTISPTDRRRMHHWTRFAAGSWTLRPAGLFKTMKR